MRVMMSALAFANRGSFVSKYWAHTRSEVPGAGQVGMPQFSPMAFSEEASSCK
jgi:hypothetical protein